MAENCSFCSNCEPVLVSNHHAIAIADKRPLARGHTLIISRVHATTIFDLPIADYIGCCQLVLEARDFVAKVYEVENFNVVANCGQEAGQTVLHAHLHLVPRYPGIVLKTGGSWTQVG